MKLVMYQSIRIMGVKAFSFTHPWDVFTIDWHSKNTYLWYAHGKRRLILFLLAHEKNRCTPNIYCEPHRYFHKNKIKSDNLTHWYAFLWCIPMRLLSRIQVMHFSVWLSLICYLMYSNVIIINMLSRIHLTLFQCDAINTLSLQVFSAWLSLTWFHLIHLIKCNPNSFVLIT